MEIWLGIAVGVVAVVVVLLFVARRTLSAPGVDPTKLSLDPAVMEQVRSLAADGKKVQAIALLRERTPGLALLPAKNMVDRMEAAAHRTASASGAPAVPPPDWMDTAPSTSEVPLDVELEARNLKAQGQSARAATMVGECTGLGADEARRYVEGL